MSLALRPAGPADVTPLLALMDRVVAWLVARGRAGQWGSEPPSGNAAFRERTQTYVAAGKVTVADRDGALSDPRGWSRPGDAPGRPERTVTVTAMPEGPVFMRPSRGLRKGLR